jgi:hypothetical protein
MLGNPIGPYWDLHGLEDSPGSILAEVKISSRRAYAVSTC